MAAFSLTSQADLLRQLRACQDDEERRLVAEILGYVLVDTSPTDTITLLDTSPVLEAIGTVVQADTVEQSVSDRNVPIPDEVFMVLRSREQYAEPDALNNDLPACLQGVEPLADEDLVPLAAGQPLSHQALVPPQRLLPFFRESLVLSSGERLDVPRLIKKVAGLEVLRRMPRKPRSLPAGRIYVLLDLNKRLLPFWQDAHELCELLVRKLGRNGLDIRLLEDRPGGDFSDWFDDEQVLQHWTPLKSPAAVLIVSDLGDLAQEGSHISLSWLSFLQRLQRQSIRPIVLSPCAQRVGHAFRDYVDLYHWGRGHRFKQQATCRADPDFPAAVRRVLGLLSVAVHVEPELLRAILGCLPLTQANSDVEAAVYAHADVVWGHLAISLKPEQREAYRAVFKQEEAAIQQQVLTLVHDHHIGQFPFVWASTVLNAAPLVNFELATITGADVSAATALMQRFARSLYGTQQHQGMMQFARRELQRLGVDESGDALGQQDFSSVMYGLAYRDAVRAGEAIDTRHDASLVTAVVRQVGELREYVVVQRGEWLFVEAASAWPPDNPLRTGSLLASFSTRADRFTVQQDGGRWHPHTPSSGESIGRAAAAEIVLDTGSEKLFLRGVVKPDWASAISCKPDGIWLEYDCRGRDYISQWLNPVGDRLGHWEGFPSDNIGLDQHGLYADLNLQNLTQRFRWIEAGTFMMGSPEDEEGCDDDEDLHQVTLTKGFWLADTTVTQALWEAVMGANPSHFKGSERPVEKVSWDDCQRFIEQLNTQISDLQAKLPSEAEWEYACRAGTQTPFSFGGKDDLALEKVNYSGQWDAADSSGETRLVKSYSPNDWGLYEMHGNVLEWCQDVWNEQLGTAALTDPQGQARGELKDARRVVRGGAWPYRGRYCRSAYRLRFTPDGRDDDVGLRLSLGHELRARSAESGASVIGKGIADSEGAGSTVAEQVQDKELQEWATALRISYEQMELLSELERHISDEGEFGEYWIVKFEDFDTEDRPDLQEIMDEMGASDWREVRIDMPMEYFPEPRDELGLF